MTKATLTPEQQLRKARKESRDLRKGLASLTHWVTAAVALLDDEMKKPSTHERGQRIACITTVLDYANDSARRFVLGDLNLKKMTPAALEKAREEFQQKYAQLRKHLGATQ